MSLGFDRSGLLPIYGKFLMDQKSALTMLEPATSIEDVHKTLSTGPLIHRPRSKHSRGAGSTMYAGVTR